MSIQVTPGKLREAARAAELRGDWDQYDLFNAVADRLLSLESQNQAYRHALASGVSINLIARKRWLKRD